MGKRTRAHELSHPAGARSGGDRPGPRLRSDPPVLESPNEPGAPAADTTACAPVIQRATADSLRYDPFAPREIGGNLVIEVVNRGTEGCRLFELRGVVPVICDAAVGAVRISGNRATLENARQCNTDHLLLVSFDRADLRRPGAARFLVDGRRLTADRSAGAALRLPAHFSGTRRLMVEAAAGDLAPLLRSLRIAVQPI